MDSIPTIGDELRRALHLLKGALEEAEKDGEVLADLLRIQESKSKSSHEHIQSNLYLNIDINSEEKAQSDQLRKMRGEYIKKVDILSTEAIDFENEFKSIKIKIFQMHVNTQLLRKLNSKMIWVLEHTSKPISDEFVQDIPTESVSYDEKRAIVEFLNSQTRQQGAALAHPETQEPCILFALPTKDKTGRYTLENRKTKKRSGYYKSIVELLPIKLVPDVPRKEGFLEVRKKKSEKPPE